MKYYSILDGDNITVHRKLLRLIRKLESKDGESSKELESRIKELEIKTEEFERDISELHAKDEEFERDISELHAKDEELEARIKALEDDKPEPELTDVTFFVKPKNDGADVGIEDAEITFQGTVKRTNSEGRVTFENVKTGLQDITVMEPFYDVFEQKIDITDSSYTIELSGVSVPIDFLITDRNSPVEGATIQIDGGDSGVTDVHGEYRTNITAGTYEVIYSAPGHVTKTERIVIRVGKAHFSGYLETLSKDINVHVDTLSGEDRVPCGSVYVNYHGNIGYTDSFGNCMFSNVPLGLKEPIIVYNTNFKTELKYIEVQSDTERIDILLEEGSYYTLETNKSSLQADEECTLSAEFVNTESLQEPENLVIIDGNGNNKGTFPFDVETHTGSGEYVARGKGNIRLLVGANNIWSNPVFIRDTVDSNYVQFHIISESNEPIPYATIHILSADALWSELYSGNTTSDGCLTLHIPRGAYKIVIDHGNYESFEEDYFDLEHTEYVEVKMKEKT